MSKITAGFLYKTIYFILISKTIYTNGSYWQKLNPEKKYIYFMKSIFHFSFILFIAACSTTKQASQKNIDIAKYSSKLSDTLNQKQLAGIDFSAQGDQPLSWTLDADMDKIFYFNAGNDIKISTRALGASVSADSATIYTANSPQGIMKIFVYNTPCSVSGNKKTSVSLNGFFYTGCGQYLYDYHLNDDWVLENVKGKDIDAKDFSKGLPHLLFSIAAQTLSGSDGCGNVSGSFEVQGNNIKFGNVATTKSNCGNNQVSKIFTQLLSNHSASYSFNNGRLYLYLIDDSMLIFKKAN